VLGGVEPIRLTTMGRIDTRLDPLNVPVIVDAIAAVV